MRVIQTQRYAIYVILLPVCLFVSSCVVYPKVVKGRKTEIFTDWKVRVQGICCDWAVDGIRLSKRKTKTRWKITKGAAIEMAGYFYEPDSDWSLVEWIGGGFFVFGVSLICYPISWTVVRLTHLGSKEKEKREALGPLVNGKVDLSVKGNSFQVCTDSKGCIAFSKIPPSLLVSACKAVTEESVTNKFIRFSWNGKTSDLVLSRKHLVPWFRKQLVASHAMGDEEMLLKLRPFIKKGLCGLGALWWLRQEGLEFLYNDVIAPGR